MSVSSIGSSSTAYAPAVRPQAEAQAAGRDVKNDGDSDDGGAAVKASAPTVNLSGQAVGKLVNVSA